MYLHYRKSKIFKNSHIYLTGIEKRLNVLSLIKSQRNISAHFVIAHTPVMVEIELLLAVDDEVEAIDDLCDE